MVGCASTNFVQSRSVTVDGKPYTYVFGQSCNHTGLQMVVIDRYNENGELMARDYGACEGIMQKVIPAAVHGGLTAGGLIGAAALLEPDQTNVTQSGGSVNAALTSSSNSNSNSESNASAISSSKSKANQSQSQGQGQSQMQGQGQFITPWNKKNTCFKPD